MPPLPQGQSKLKKAILILSFLILTQCLFSQKEDYYFYKADGIFLSPVEGSDKEIDKILKVLTSKKYKKVKSKLYNLKLEFKNNEDIKILEKFIDFLEKEEDKGTDLLELLNKENKNHIQIKAEILWLLGKKYDSFNLYENIFDYISSKKPVFNFLEKRIQDSLKEMEINLKETLSSGNFDGFCLNLKRFPEKLFKGDIFFKGKTLCLILEGDREGAEFSFQKMAEKDKKEMEIFMEIMGLNFSQQVERIKSNNISSDFKKFAMNLYNKIEDKWLLENVPPCYLNAYNSKQINLKEMALLFCLYFPQAKAEIPGDLKGIYKNLEPSEFECLYPFFLGKVIEEDKIYEKISGDSFIFYLKKFISFLNLLDPCNGTWDGYVNCGFIPAEKNKDEIEGKFVASIIRKVRGQ